MLPTLSPLSPRSLRLARLARLSRRVGGLALWCGGGVVSLGSVEALGELPTSAPKRVYFVLTSITILL